MQEINYQTKHDPALINIPGFTWEMDCLLEKNGRSRSAFLVSDKLRYERRNDLETNLDSHVWLTLHLHAGKKINVQSYYRQWQEMGETNAIPNTAGPANQKKRINAIASLWRTAMNERETHSFSDTNVNLNTMGQAPHEMSINEHKQIPILNILQHEILNNGSSVVKTEDTRYNHQSKKTDSLDHCISTHPEKIINNKIHKTGDSDHRIGEFTLQTTTKPNYPKYVMSRNYKKVDWDKLKSYIANNPKLKAIYDLDDPTQICMTIQEVILYYLDLQAPLKKIQIDKKYQYSHQLKPDKPSKTGTKHSKQLLKLTTRMTGDFSRTSKTE